MKNIITISILLIIVIVLSSCMENVQTIAPTAEPSETETATQNQTETNIPETTLKKLPTIEDVVSVYAKGNTIHDVCKVLGEYEDYVIGYYYAWYFWTLDDGKKATLWFTYDDSATDVNGLSLDGYSISNVVSYDIALKHDKSENVMLDELKKDIGEPLYINNYSYVWQVDNGQYLKYYTYGYSGGSIEMFKESEVQIIERVPYDKTLEVKPGMTFQEAVDILGYIGISNGSAIVRNYGWELDNGQFFNIRFDTGIKADSVIAEVSYIGIAKE